MMRSIDKVASAVPKKTDLCIIGSGFGGRLVAAKAAEAGASVIHVSLPDVNASLSGPLVAPRAFIEAANLFYRANGVAALGLNEAESSKRLIISHCYDDLLRRIHHANKALSLPLSDTRLEALQVSLLAGETRFQDAKTICVEGQRIIARRYVLAPLYEWIIPAIQGVNEIDYLTPDRPLMASHPIKKLVVIGASVSAFALAQAHRRLGASVILVPGPDFELTSAEDEISRQILMSLERDGVLLKLDSRVTYLEACGRETIVHTACGEVFSASHVLIAPVLRPIFSNPGWEAAQVDLNFETPKLDDLLRTSNHRIHVVGVCADDDIFSTKLEHDADLIVDHALFGRRHAPCPVTHLIPTTPEIAVIGLDEEQARQQYRKIRVLRSSYGAHPLNLARSHRMDSFAGEIKVIAARNGRIVGCAIVGDGAADIAGLWTLAIARKLKLADLTDLSFPDFSHHSITRRSVRISVFGWPQSRNLLLHLMRWWYRLGARRGDES